MWRQILLFSITTKPVIFTTKSSFTKKPAKRQRVGAFKNFSQKNIMIKDRITAFGYRQKPFLFVTPIVPCSIILLLQLNPWFLQLNRSKLQLNALFLQLNVQILQLKAKKEEYPL